MQLLRRILAGGDPLNANSQGTQGAATGVGVMRADTSTALLRAIAEVLDIRALFPRVSEIVKPVFGHDALELVLRDRNGGVTLEARSTDNLPGSRGCVLKADEAFHIVSDLRRPRPRLVGCDADVDDDLIAAGHRSVLNVRSVARHQVMRLGFFSKQAGAYEPADVSTPNTLPPFTHGTVPTPQFTVSLLWHPQLDADPAHRWLRGCVQDACAEPLTNSSTRARNVERSDLRSHVATRRANRP